MIDLQNFSNEHSSLISTIQEDEIARDILAENILLHLGYNLEVPNVIDCTNYKKGQRKCAINYLICFSMVASSTGPFIPIGVFGCSYLFSDCLDDNNLAYSGCVKNGGYSILQSISIKFENINTCE